MHQIWMTGSWIVADKSSAAFVSKVYIWRSRRDHQIEVWEERFWHMTSVTKHPSNAPASSERADMIFRTLCSKHILRAQRLCTRTCSSVDESSALVGHLAWQRKLTISAHSFFVIGQPYNHKQIRDHDDFKQRCQNVQFECPKWRPRSQNQSGDNFRQRCWLCNTIADFQHCGAALTQWLCCFSSHSSLITTETIRL